MSKFVPVFKLRQLSIMTHNRFDELWSCLRWSWQPERRIKGQTYAEYRWMLVDDFVKIFNGHRGGLPSTYVCVDESIVRWYKHGGGWINFVSPHYICD